MRVCVAALSFLPALGLGACGERPAATESPIPVLSATEVLRVGSLDDPDYALTWFSMVEVGPDGRIYTLHPMEQVVRAFSPDGALEFVIGGRGEGPGEFLRPFEMGRISDTLWVNDNANNRFTLFSLAGELIGSVRVPLNAQVDDPDARRALPETLLPGGRIHAALLAPTHKIVDGTITHDVRVLMDRDGLVTDTIARIPFGEGTWEITDPDNPRAARLYTGQPLADSPLSALAFGEDAFWVVDRTVGRGDTGSDYEVAKITFAGDTVFRRAFPANVEPASDAAIDSLLTTTTDRLADGPIGQGVGRGKLRGWVERDFYRPSARAGVMALIVGRDGTLWLQEAGKWEAEADTWLVLGPDGEPLARVTLPTDLRVLATDANNVWGSRTDELDVPYVVRFRVVRAEPGGH
ncbi:MAG: 6-bladed beta-propeller [Gemmatimonadota bacterium]